MSSRFRRSIALLIAVRLLSSGLVSAQSTQTAASMDATFTVE